MSILIKGMKMPSGCISCDFCNPFADEPYCRRLMRKTPKVTRLKDCPLVEIPKPQNRPATWGDVFDSLKVLEALLETIEAEEGEDA